MDVRLGQPEPEGLHKTESSERNARNASSLYRKSIKPLIEKRRRARINASLEQLRKLLQQAPDQQNARALSRLEKAEILEMTVQQLQRLKQQGAGAAASPASDSQDFAAGYRHCINTVSTFLSSAGSSLDQAMKTQILQTLEETPRDGPPTISAPASKVWHPHKADTLHFPQPFLWTSPPPPPMPARPLHLDSNNVTVGSWPQPSTTSNQLLQLRMPWTQPNTPAAATNPRMWRPW